MVRCLAVMPEALHCVRQVHGDRILEVTRGAERRQWLDTEGDALMTRGKGIAVGIVTADAPLLVADPTSGWVAAAHLGRLGALAGLAGKLVRRLQERGACLETMIFAVGPHIQASSYEVGEAMFAALPLVAHSKTSGGDTVAVSKGSSAPIWRPWACAPTRFSESTGHVQRSPVFSHRRQGCEASVNCRPSSEAVRVVDSYQEPPNRRRFSIKRLSVATSPPSIIYLGLRPGVVNPTGSSRGEIGHQSFVSLPLRADQAEHDPHCGMIASYARSDHHRVLKDTLLEELSEELRQRHGEGFVYAPPWILPFLSVIWPSKKGLVGTGGRGRSIHPEVGEWLTRATCRRPRDRCGRRAGVASRSLWDLPPLHSSVSDIGDSSRRLPSGLCRCISYWTIETRGMIPRWIRERMGRRVFGCDDCTMVCPWNRRSSRDVPAGLEPRRENMAPVCWNSSKIAFPRAF